MPPQIARKPLNTYHHGDLRGALVQAALKEAEQGGPEAISIKALAKQLGVSQPAPYRHFADREALLAAVAAEALRQFCATLRAAIEKPSKRSKLSRLARATLELPAAPRTLASSLVWRRGDRALQITEYGAQVGHACDRPDIRHQHSADLFAMAILGPGRNCRRQPKDRQQNDTTPFHTHTVLHDWMCEARQMARSPRRPGNSGPHYQRRECRSKTSTGLKLSEKTRIFGGKLVGRRAYNDRRVGRAG